VTLPQKVLIAALFVMFEVKTDVDARIILKWVLKRWDGKALTGLQCFSIGIDGRHF
jgi:pantothenate kinase